MDAHSVKQKTRTRDWARRNRLSGPCALALVLALTGASFGQAVGSTTSPLRTSIQRTQLVSINRAGTIGGNDSSGTPVLSANGRFVAFASFASDLVARDANGTNDVFVRDLRTGTTTLVSVNRAGTGSGNGASSTRVRDRIAGQSAPDTPALSADGRFVAFTSWASDLVANDSNGLMDVFVRDLRTGTTVLASVNLAGAGSGQADDPNGSFGLALSANGRFVAFTSGASDLVANDTNGHLDAFVRDLQTRTTTLVSVNKMGTNGGNSDSVGIVISVNGRFVGFGSSASDLVATDTVGQPNAFVRDLKTGITTLVSVNNAGTGSGNGVSYTRSPPSSDGRFVVFESWASDLVTSDTNGTADVFVRDLQMETTSLVSVNQAGTNSGNGSSEYGHVLSADGRFVAFASFAGDLVARDTNGTNDVFVRDLRTGTTTLVSVNRAGTDSGHAQSNAPSLSADSRFVGFFSQADDLALDTHGIGNAFVRDLQSGTTTLVSVNRSGIEGGNHQSDGAVLSANGRFATFMSAATDLVATDTNGTDNVFVTRITANTAPSCRRSRANPATLWSHNHRLVPVVVLGVSDRDGDPVRITVTGVAQDEPVNAKGDGNTSPDAVIHTGAAAVRAERSRNGNGRVYHLSFRADDGQGGFCTGEVRVSVPYSRNEPIAIDDGPAYDSTIP